MKKSLFIMLFVCLFSFGAFAADYVYDYADLFTYEEEAEIAFEAEAVYTNSGLRCVILTDYGIGDITSELPIYSDAADDMVLVTVDMSAREFYLYQYNAIEGESAFRISQGESDTILDGMLDYMAGGDYFNAALSFLELSEASFNNAETFNPSHVGDDYTYVDYPVEESGFSFELIGASALVGAMVGGIAVLFVWLSYKKKVHGTIYPLGQFAKLDLVEHKDTFINTTKVITRIPDPPSSSGGFRGGGGGGFRGGGGGARMGGRSF